MRPLIEKLDTAMVSGKVEDLIRELGELEGDERTLRCARWWILALRHRAIQLAAVSWKLFRESMRTVQQFRGKDPDIVQKIEASHQKISTDLADWETEAREFWRELTLSDEDEYFASRAGSVRSLLN